MGWIKWWFWAPPKSGETWALTFVRIAGNWLRLGITAAAISLAAFGVYIEHQNRSYRADHDDLSDVTVSAALVPEKCGKSFPLAITVRNTGVKAVASLSIDAQARYPGYSTNLLTYPHDTPKWDRYVLPGKEATLCFGFPEPLIGAGVVVSARPRYGDFVAPEAWMAAETGEETPRDDQKQRYDAEGNAIPLADPADPLGIR